MSPAQKMTPAFRTLVNGISRGEVLTPIIQNYLYDPKFPSFEIDIHGWQNRKPDGWFHPSTHPLMGERALFYYMSQPDRWQGEVFDPTSVMTVTQGHFWHEFIQICLLDAGALQPNPKPTKGRNRAEWGWAHEETRSRGHSDGLTPAEEIFEFKTMRAAKAAKIPRGNPDDEHVRAAFRSLAPDYYAQAMEYMRISKRTRWRAIILSLEWPFPLREITLEYDPFFAHEIAAKYERVLQAMADQRPPMFCCAGGKAASGCGARLICEMGSVTR